MRDLQEGLRNAEDVVAEHAIAARTVRHLGGQLGVRHLRDHADGGVQEPVEPRDQLVRRQHRAGCLVKPEELDHVADVLREHVVVAARQHGDRAGSQPPQLIEPGGVFQHVDGLELDRTDREKLFEFQAAGSSRLPEHLQRDRVHGWLSCVDCRAASSAQQAASIRPAGRTHARSST